MRSPIKATLYALLAVVSLAVVCPSQAYASENGSTVSAHQSERKGTSLHITNRDGLVIVWNADNKAVFAQVIPTPNVHLEFDATKFFNTMTIVLRDGNNKKIWDHKIDSGGASNFAMNFGQQDSKPATVTADGLTISLTPTETDETIDAPNHIKGDILLASDNLLVHAEISGKGEGMRFERVGDTVQMYRIEKGTKTLTGTVNIDKDKKFVSASINNNALKGAVNGAAGLVDNVGMVKVGSLVKGGKTYIDLDLGDRHIYIEGILSNIQTDGSNITIDTKAKDAKQN